MLGTGIVPPGSILVSLTGIKNIRKSLDWWHKSGSKEKETYLYKAFTYRRIEVGKILRNCLVQE